MLNNIFDEIKKANAIVILTHQYPDGDAISSCLALKLWIGKKADVVIPSFPESFSFLPYSEIIKKESREEYDLAIALDCANAKRLVGYDEYFRKAKQTVVIDHHITNERFANYNFVDAKAPACTQILASIFDEEKITKDIATCLLAGIISDTSGLLERNITSDTFSLVAVLASKGADYKAIHASLMQNCTREQFRLKQLVISRVVLKDNIAMSYLTETDILGSDTIDHKYLLKEYQYIDGIDVIILFIEYSNGIKVSLRSEKVDVLQICKKFNGGGHKNSAGCIIQDTLENVKNKILKELI